MITPTACRNFAAALLSLAAIAFGTEASAYGDVFLNTRSDSSDISAFTKWTGVAPRYEQQKASIDQECTRDDCPNVKWEKLLSRLEGQPRPTQIREINQFFNAMPYVTDQKNWGVDDYWETPYELMSRGGDCEDYAIAKYISLQRLGFNTSDMRIIIVHDQRRGGEMHAILEVSSDNDRVLLDNQNPRVVAEAEVTRYRPIYALNDSRWWAY